MPAIYHEGSWLGNATDPEVLVKDTVGWTGKNQAFSQTNNAVIAHIENGISYNVSWIGSATITLKKDSSSGTTITSGSESPLSFTADADYDLYFGSSANVTDIMVWDSRIVDPTYEPYHESVEEEIEQIYAGNGVLGAKNLLNNEAVSQTSSGVTITVNSDKSITTTGTNSSSTTSVEFPIVAKTSISSIKNGMILSGSKDFNSGLWGMAISYYNSSGTYIGQQNCFADGVVLSIPSNAVQYRIFMFVKPSQTISNKTAYPMLRLASDPDDTYQPYAMTNRELTEVEDVTSKATFSTSVTWNTGWNHIYRNGKHVWGTIRFTTPSTVSSDLHLISLPDGLKPASDGVIFGILVEAWSGAHVGVLNYGGGYMQIASNVWAANKAVVCSFNYLTK